MTTRLAAFTLVLLASAPADAASVLCKRRSNVVVLRDACRPTESPIDAQAVGIVGPPGPAGPPSGIACTARCVPGSPDVTVMCGGTVTTCPSADGAPVHATVFDCASTGTLAVPFCAAATCSPGDCPSTDFAGDAAKDARNAAAAQDAYFVQHETYATSCAALPGFASSPGAICSTVLKACANGTHGFAVATVDRTQTTCFWDSCPPSGVRLNCSSAS